MELYLCTDENTDFNMPIKVLQYEKVNILNRNCLIVDLEKGIDYEEFGIKSLVSKFILVDRFFDNRLNTLNEFPIEVHAFIPKNPDNPLHGFTSWNDLINAAWTNIYNNYEDAAKHVV
ncbi:MAG: hypothetical protein H0X33_14365 [Taibaiella sp.]|nr:hypothetical protein [Taibaiella sp.]